jgi:murein DD-endopeptidase MepM/ murein hydrolase activator NlpD
MPDLTRLSFWKGALRQYRVPVASAVVGLALVLLVSAPLLHAGAPPEPAARPDTAVTLDASLGATVGAALGAMDEERAADVVAAIPSVRGIIGPRRTDALRGSRPAPVRGTPARLGLAAEDDLLAAADTTRFLTNDEGFLMKQATPLTIAARRLRKDLIVYKVEEGDNVSTLAEKFDLTTDTIVWANGDLEADPDFLSIGQDLNILPVPGVLHTVVDGDTLESVAKKYKADSQAIIDLDWNKLKAPYTLTAGQKIIVPDGEKPYNPRVVYLPDGRQILVGAPKGLGRFVWPTQGYITTRFGEGGHRGLDIAAYMGAPIYAADAGAVTYAGPLGGYGLAVVIDHGNGFQSLYGHLSVYYPRAGQAIKRGQAIGKMGSTGNSTGPHLHLEITLWGGLVNPAAYLP